MSAPVTSVRTSAVQVDPARIVRFALGANNMFVTNIGKITRSTVELLRRLIRMLTQKRALEFFEYNPRTGVVISRIGVQRRAAGTVVGTKFCQKNGYVYVWVKVDGTQYLLARVIWLMQTGEWPDEVDHKNLDPSDNRWKNLRSVDHQANSRNQSLSKTNKSGRVGVHWSQSRKKWCVYIGVDRKTINLGRYDDFDDAVATRVAAEQRYGFHPNHGNSRVVAI